LLPPVFMDLNDHDDHGEPLDRFALRASGCDSPITRRSACLDGGREPITMAFTSPGFLR